MHFPHVNLRMQTIYEYLHCDDGKSPYTKIEEKTAWDTCGKNPKVFHKNLTKPYTPDRLIKKPSFKMKISP